MKTLLPILLGLTLLISGCGSGSQDCGGTTWKDEHEASISFASEAFTVLLSQLGTYWEDSASAHCEYERETTRPVPAQPLKANVCVFGPEPDAVYGCNLLGKTTVDLSSGVAMPLDLKPGEKAVVAVPKQGLLTRRDAEDSVTWWEEAWFCGDVPPLDANGTTNYSRLYGAMSARDSVCQ